MKTFIVTLLVAIAITSCSEDDPHVQTDPFIGSWALHNIEHGLKVSFDVSQENKELSFHKINIEYPEITEALDYHVETYGRFPVNTGFEEITIFGSGDKEWITITMLHNRIHLKTRNILDVYNMEVSMINRVPIVLKNQKFTRIN